MCACFFPLLDRLRRVYRANIVFAGKIIKSNQLSGRSELTDFYCSPGRAFGSIIRARAKTRVFPTFPATDCWSFCSFFFTTVSIMIRVCGPSLVKLCVFAITDRFDARGTHVEFNSVILVKCTRVKRPSYACNVRN